MGTPQSVPPSGFLKHGPTPVVDDGLVSSMAAGSVLTWPFHQRPHGSRYRRIDEIRRPTTVTPPPDATSCTPADPCTTVGQTCPPSATGSCPTGYCCTQSLDWVEGRRCVLEAA